jgi:hypothetical protein
MKQSNIRFQVDEIIGDAVDGMVRVVLEWTLYTWVATNEFVLKERGIAYENLGVSEDGYILRNITIGDVSFLSAYKGPRFTADGKAEYMFYAKKEDALKHFVPRPNKKAPATSIASFFKNANKTIVRSKQA